MYANLALLYLPLLLGTKKAKEQGSIATATKALALGLQDHQTGQVEFFAS